MTEEREGGRGRGEMGRKRGDRGEREQYRKTHATAIINGNTSVNEGY